MIPADRIEILQGDLTETNADAIVNAANNDLQLGGGVAGAIRRKGGPQFRRNATRLGRFRWAEQRLLLGAN